jgi:NADPH:quinone reductase-like Zn-dependent oxidoreductase
MATGARVWVVGVGSGARIELDLLSLMAARARIGGSMLRSRDVREKANVAGAVAAHVVPLFASGAVRVPVCATFPLSEAPAAYERFARGSKFGKVVLTTG